MVLLFVDAFGWRFFEQYHQRSPFLQRVVEQGLVSKLTSQFPSTTAAHVTTIHTGLPVGESGVYEWYYYEPLLDRMIAPLLFSFAGDSDRNTLTSTGISARALYPSQSLYQDLQPHGVDLIVFQHHSYAHSPYSKTVTNGARMVPYRTLPEALVNLGQLLERQKRKSYYFLYVDSIDTICHRYGPDAPQTAAEIEAFLAIMELIFHKNLASKKRRTLFLLTADHGQIAIDPGHHDLYQPALSRNAALARHQPGRSAARRRPVRAAICFCTSRMRISTRRRRCCSRRWPAAPRSTACRS